RIDAAQNFQVESICRLEFQANGDAAVRLDPPVIVFKLRVGCDVSLAWGFVHVLTRCVTRPSGSRLPARATTEVAPTAAATQRVVSLQFPAATRAGCSSQWRSRSTATER